MVGKRNVISKRNCKLGNISPGSKNLLWESYMFQQSSALLNNPWGWLATLSSSY